MNSLDDLSLLLKHLLIISPKYAKKCSKFQCLHCSWFDESDQNILWSGKIWNSPTVSPTLAVREKYFHQYYLNTSKYKSMPQYQQILSVKILKKTSNFWREYVLLFSSWYENMFAWWKFQHSSVRSCPARLETASCLDHARDILGLWLVDTASPDHNTLLSLVGSLTEDTFSFPTLYPEFSLSQTPQFSVSRHSSASRLSNSKCVKSSDWQEASDSSTALSCDEKLHWTIEFFYKQQVTSLPDLSFY